jgi:ribosomal protein S18 acetylase RimI-like enzyme
MAVLQIQDYRETDREFVVELSDANLPELQAMEAGRYPPGYVRNVGQWFDEGVRGSWARRSLFYVAELDGEPAGFIIGGPANDPWTPAPGDTRPPQTIGEIYELHVRKVHRRNGIGSALLIASVRELAHQGFAYVTLGHLGRNRAASQLYASKGYQPRWVVQERKLITEA